MCREYDYVARIVGDEFVLIVPGIEPAGYSGKIAALERVVVNAGLTVCGERLAQYQCRRRLLSGKWR
jgi:GGDEF domain-containing protein